MKTAIQYTLTVNNKKCSYTLKQASEETTHVKCEDANIDQEFLNEDIPNLLMDLPNLITAEKEHSETQNKVIRFRVTAEDKKKIEKNAAKEGYSSVSNFIRDLSLGRV